MWVWGPSGVNGGGRWQRVEPADGAGRLGRHVAARKGGSRSHAGMGATAEAVEESAATRPATSRRGRAGVAAGGGSAEGGAATRASQV